MFNLLHNTSSCFQRPDILWDQRGRRTLIATAVLLLRKTEAWLIKKRHLSLFSCWAKDTQKNMFMLGRCMKIQELSSKPMCWITKESTQRCLPAWVSFSTWGFWVAFPLLHSRKRIVARGTAMPMSPKMMRITVTSVAKSNNANGNQI